MTKVATKKKTPPTKAKAARPAPRVAMVARKPVAPKKAAVIKPARPPVRAVAAPVAKRAKLPPATVNGKLNGKSHLSAGKPSSNGKVGSTFAPGAVESAPNPVAKTAPPAGLKSKRNLAGLASKELTHFRDLLIHKRHEILGDMHSMEREALRVEGGTLATLPVHVADMGTDNYEQEFTLGLVEKERSLLREIYAALAKMQVGTYGICEGTGAPISKARLEVQPWARYSIEFARQREKSTMGIR